MKGSRISSRYAKSLLGLAKETGKLDTLYKDMKLVSDTCEESKELLLLLKSPIVKSGKKIQVFDQLFYGQLDDLSKSFLELITKGGREGMLVEIALEFQEQYKREKKIVTATIGYAFVTEIVPNVGDLWNPDGNLGICKTSLKCLLLLILY